MTSIVLVQPEIPGNTGAVGRTCVALDMELVLIHPLGFEISDKRVKRSGLDYWQHIRLVEFASWEAFMAERAPRGDQMFRLSRVRARNQGDTRVDPGRPSRCARQIADAVRPDTLAQSRQHRGGGGLSGGAGAYLMLDPGRALKSLADKLA